MEKVFAAVLVADSFVHHVGKNTNGNTEIPQEQELIIKVMENFTGMNDLTLPYLTKPEQTKPHLTKPNLTIPYRNDLPIFR